MENFTIGFSRPKKWKPFAWLIMTAYKIPYSHVYIKFYSLKYNRWLIYQASGSMVNFMNIELFMDHADIVHEVKLDLPEQSRAKIIQFVIDYCGKPYGIKECLGFAIVKIASWFGKEITNPLSDNDNTLVCSELASLILKNCLNISLPKDPDDMSPKDVYDLLNLSNETN